jgi:hypothetical protein
MKRILSSVVTSLVTILIGSGCFAMNLQAQDDEAITASIPFPFTVGNQTIAPGTYRFGLQSSPFLLSVIDMKTGDTEIFSVHPEQQRTYEQHGLLVFRKEEGSRILSEVHLPGTEVFSEVLEGRGKRRTEAKKSSTCQAVTVAQR